MGYLDGKAIVITGGGRGIGRACCKLAAGEGARVVVNDVDREVAEEVVAEIVGAGGTAVAAPGDISSWAAAEAVVATCVHEFGLIDGLVNNAAIFSVSSPWELDEAQARSMLEVNVLGVMGCGTAALRRMVTQGSGSIVNMVSRAHFGMPKRSVYGATKGAVASLTYGWALDLVGTPIRVNAVSPVGSTRMTDPSRLAPDPATNAPSVVFLLSDRAAGISGQILWVEGDKLGLIAHPAVMEPVLTGDWTVERVEDAFREVLEPRAAPLGTSHRVLAQYVPTLG